MGGGKRNGKIDLLKFIFSLIIVIHHGKNIIGEREDMFMSGGSFAVEFFFIVSGYLLMLSISKIKDNPTALGIETWNFIVKKYKSFCPEIFVAYLIALVVYNGINQIGLPKLFINSFFEGTLLHMFGIHIVSINSAVWYISSMLLCMLIIYPLIRKYPDFSTKYILPLSALLLLGYFCSNGRSPRAPTEWMGWTYRGNLRAFAELSIGVCCYEICKRLKRINFTFLGSCLLTLIEYTCYTMLVYYMYFFKSSRQDYFYIIMYMIAIIISFSEKTIDTKIFDNKLFYFLGKYSFSLYLSHAFYATNLNMIFPSSFGNLEKMLIYLVCSIITALIVMIISDLIRKKSKIITIELKKILIK